MIRSIIEPEVIVEAGQPPVTGWSNQVHAYQYVEYLVEQLAEHGYSDIVVSTEEQGGRHQVIAGDTKARYTLTSHDEVLWIVDQARNHTLDIGNC